MGISGEKRMDARSAAAFRDELKIVAQGWPRLRKRVFEIPKISS
jgi:hypothetical protein